MKTIFLVALVLSVAFATKIDLNEIQHKLPPINVETQEILKSVANYACEPGNCLPIMPNVCPFQFLCQLYCKEEQKEGACREGACKCF